MPTPIRPRASCERGRVGGGVEWRIPCLTATVYPTQSWGTLSRPGGVATVDWLGHRPDAARRLGELYSGTRRCAALLFGITADEYAAKASYRWHESRSIAASFAYLPFTDGNQRFTGGVTYKERLINMPGFDLTGLAEGYALEQQPGESRPTTIPSAGPVADRRPAGRARAVAALRQQPGAGADRRCRPLSEQGYRRQLDRHDQLRAPLALRSADRVPLRRHAEPAGL